MERRLIKLLIDKKGRYTTAMQNVENIKPLQGVKEEYVRKNNFWVLKSDVVQCGMLLTTFNPQSSNHPLFYHLSALPCCL